MRWGGREIEIKGNVQRRQECATYDRHSTATLRRGRGLSYYALLFTVIDYTIYYHNLSHHHCKSNQIKSNQIKSVKAVI